MNIFCYLGSVSHLSISFFEFYKVADSSPINLLIIDIYHPSHFPGRLEASKFLSAPSAFFLFLNNCYPTHKSGNVLELVFRHFSSA